MLINTNDPPTSSPPSSTFPSSSLFSAPSSTSTSTASPTAPPLITPRTLPTHQLFRLALPHDNHVLFLQTSPLTPTGLIFFLHPSARLPAEQTISHPDALISVVETTLLGTVASENVGQLREVCRETTLEEWDASLPVVGFRRCRDWVRETVSALVRDEVMRPTPPAATGHHLPRHHHTAHCQHQRRHIHHPYRRRRAHLLLENQMLSAAATVQKRD